MHHYGMHQLRYRRRTVKKKAAQLRRKATATERFELLEQRRRLQSRIDALERKADQFMPTDESTAWDRHKEKGLDSGDNSETDSDSEGHITISPEYAHLPLPSALAPAEVQRLHLQAIAAEESGLRRGQINDALDGLRLALGEKSLLLRTEVRNAKSQRTTLKAWDGVNKQDVDARRYREIYRDARDAMERLAVHMDFLNTLRDITDDDMKMSGDIIEENRVGQRSDTLAWFWRISNEDAEHEEIPSDRLKECEINICSVSNPC
jgi:hypothetical protein